MQSWNPGIVVFAGRVSVDREKRVHIKGSVLSGEKPRELPLPSVDTIGSQYVRDGNRHFARYVDIGSYGIGSMKERCEVCCESSAPCPS